MNEIEKIRARLGEISARLQILAGFEEPSDADITEMEQLTSEFEASEKKLSALEKTASTLAKSQTSTRQTSATPTSARVEVVREAADRFGGFKSSGEFFKAVRAAANGDMHPVFKSTAYEKNGEDGGFLVPEEVSTAIVNKMKVQESLWSKANVYNVNGNNLTLTLDESQPWNQGVQAYWTEEGGTITDSKPKFTNASWRLKKVAALVKATDELLDDATALESYIKNSAPEAIMHKVNGAIISGNGVGKPEGILNSPFTVSVAKESGQAADTIVARNITKMYSRMIPSARPGAAWYINAGAEEQLMALKDDNGNFIYLSPGSQMNQTPYGMLLGRPVIPMMGSLPALGDQGDILFANLGYYYGIQKTGGIKQATSIHAEFAKEITAFRFSLRLDAKCPFKTPVTTEFGNHSMSAFVVLDARA